jgi:hypothetical protein
MEFRRPKGLLEAQPVADGRRDYTVAVFVSRVKDEKPTHIYFDVATKSSRHAFYQVR